MDLRPPFQALLTFEKLVKLCFFDHLSIIKTDNQDQKTDENQILFLLKIFDFKLVLSKQ